MWPGSCVSGCRIVPRFGRREPARRRRTRPSSPSVGTEPLAAHGKEVPVGQEVQPPAGGRKVLTDLGEYGGHGRRPVGRLLRNPIRPPPKLLEQPYAVPVFRTFPIRRCQHTLQSASLALGDQSLGGVIREDAG